MTAAIIMSLCKRRWIAVGYPALRAEQKTRQEAFRRGETRQLLGIGVSFFTEIVGAGPPAIATFLGWHVRFGRDPHPSDRLDRGANGHQEPGQGHETTYAQIIARSSASPPMTSP